MLATLNLQLLTTDLGGETSSLQAFSCLLYTYPSPRDL